MTWTLRAIAAIAASPCARIACGAFVTFCTARIAWPQAWATRRLHLLRVYHPEFHRRQPSELFLPPPLPELDQAPDWHSSWDFYPGWALSITSSTAKA